MLYRRKLLLALVEVCGGFVQVSHCQAYLALFSDLKHQKYYHFFLSPSGYYSLVLAHDKNQLTKSGFFSIQEAFHLQTEQSFLAQLCLEDQLLLQTIVTEPVLLKDPTLFTNHLYTEEEISISETSAKTPTQLAQDPVLSIPCLFTLGYEGISIDEYLNLLIAQRISLLVDVRKNPFSRKYGFSKQQLLYATSLAGIRYRHLPALGIPTVMRQNLDSTAAYQKFFEHYALHMLPEQSDAIRQIKQFLAEFGRIALTCFEANPQFCHRHKITAHLLQNDATYQTPIVHLAAETAIISNDSHEIIRIDVPGQEHQNNVYVFQDNLL